MKYIKIWLVNADLIYANLTNTKLTSADKASDIHIVVGHVPKWISM